MKIFISWSGDLSHKVALIFKDWLPLLIQSVETYVSSEDIDKGARWSSDISKALEESFFGILCITEDNLEAPWINFEAGALSKSFEKSRISPFLFEITRAELQGPLLQFQSTIFDKEDIKKLIFSINNACDNMQLEEARVEKLYELAWPQLESSLKNLKEELSKSGTARKERKLSKEHLIEEILLLVRNQQQLLSKPENILPPQYLKYMLHELRLNRSLDSPLVYDLLESFYFFDIEFLKLLKSKDFNSFIGEEDYNKLEKSYHMIRKTLSYIGRKTSKYSKEFSPSNRDHLICADKDQI